MKKLLIAAVVATAARFAFLKWKDDLVDIWASLSDDNHDSEDLRYSRLQEAKEVFGLHPSPSHDREPQD